MPSELISVVIPTYQRAGVIGRSIESVISQTYENLELVIIDDGSTDKTQEVVEQYKKCSTKIKYFKSINMGANVARNIGIAMSKGSYIAFLDSDDVWLPNRLELIQDEINRTSPDMLITDYRSNTSQNSSLHEELIWSKDFSQIILSHNFLGGTFNAVIKKSSLLNIEGFDIRLKSCQDQDLYVRILQNGELKYVKNTLAIYYRDSANRISGVNNNKLQGHIYFHRKYANRMSLLTKILSLKKIGLLNFYLKKPNFLLYTPFWIVVKILTKIYNLSDERNLYLLEDKFISFLKKT